MGSTGIDQPARLHPPDDDEWIFEIASTPLDAGVARRAVARFLVGRGVPHLMADDLELLISELITNAVRHGRPGAVGVVVRVQPGVDVSVAVSNVGPVGAIPPVRSWHIPTTLVPNGRGLGIVRQLSDDIVVQGDARRAVVRCRRRWKREETAR